MLNKTILTGAKARRERVREEMRAAIVDSASRLLAEHGVEGLTIRGVAEDLGYSPGALYEYFDSKELLLCSLYFEGTDGLGVHCEKAIDRLPKEATAIEAITGIGRAYREFALTHPELYRLAFFGLKTPPAPPEVDDPNESPGGFGLAVELINQGIAEGSLVDLPAPVMATSIWSAVHGFVSLEISGQITGSEAPGMPTPPPDEARTHRDQIFEAVLHMALFGFAREEHRPQTAS